ncbi:MAG: hypothetical protein IJH65_03950 [Methanobrevibacter sp.]|nr:hypothetical protein [Methanobrevibacter sp.]
MNDLIKFILFIISLVLFIAGIIINNETMVNYGYLLSLLTLLFLNENQIEKIVDSHKGIPFIIVMIIFFIGCVLHDSRIVCAAGSAIIFLNLRLEKENER